MAAGGAVRASADEVPRRQADRKEYGGLLARPLLGDEGGAAGTLPRLDVAPQVMLPRHSH